MKKLLNVFLAILMMCACFVYDAPDTNALGAIWVKEYYKDKFGDKTDEYYLTNYSQFEGIYNSDSVSEGVLGAKLIFERNGAELQAYLALFLNGKERVKNETSFDNSYELSVKRTDGSVFDSSGYMSPGENRILIKDSIELANALRAFRGVVKIYLEDSYDGNNNYLFSAECGNFDELFNQEILNPFKEEKYQEAEHLLEEKEFDESIEAFISLGDYKDSAEIAIEARKKASEYENLEELYKAGIIKLGHYEQDNIIDNGKEPIEWIVLVKEGSKCLLISRYALDLKPYNAKNTEITWETCSLRSWLNESFLNEAFSYEEQMAILTTEVDNGKSQGNSNLSTSGGRNTEDKVFLLSYAEAEKYFNSDSDRICKPTVYAETTGTYTDDSGNCWWWTRSAGRSQSSAAGIGYSGSLGGGDFVSAKNAVRPAFWVDLASLESYAPFIEQKTLSAQPSTPVVELPEEFKTVGNIVSLGHFEQDNNYDNGNEPIEWIVLVNEGNKSLLLSRYAIDVVPFNDHSSDNTWESCSLRSYLNGEFLDTAFSPTELELIQDSIINNDIIPGDITFSPETEDMVFLLSCSEAKELFDNSVNRKCKLTDYARSKTPIAGKNNECGWWLRTPPYYELYGKMNTNDYEVMTVDMNGFVDNWGTNVQNITCGVRPAIWIGY